MTETLLKGIRVLDLAGEPLAMAGRMLADLGADVVKLEPENGDPLRQSLPLNKHNNESLRFLAWNAGKTSVEFNSENQTLIEQLFSNADIILQTPGFRGAITLPENFESMAPQAVWLKATPFGLDGPFSDWQATDLGILAGGGNLFATGFPGRPPVRCAEPSSYGHASTEAVFAVLMALHAQQPQVIDLSMAETMAITNMGGAGQYKKTGRVIYRMGSNIGRTREVWPCKDGGFVSFGLRGGRARLNNFKILLGLFEEADIKDPAWFERDWETYDVDSLSDAELVAIEEPLKKLFMTRTMGEWYELAAATNLMIASANTPKEIYESSQIRAREFFGEVDGIKDFPKCWIHARQGDDSFDTNALHLAPKLNSAITEGKDFSHWLNNNYQQANPKNICDGLKIVEFGAGAAGPISARYFAEHGATVIKVESKSRPDFLRAMAFASPHKLEGSTLFEAMNPGKYSIALNLKSEEGIAVAKQLMQWADAVQENFAPKAMKGFGLDYDSMVKEIPDLVMISTCLNGQTGPHKNYPGFGSQGAALSGYNELTGFPDSDPITPFGTVTDSLGPRFTAAALAAGLLYKQRTGKGVYFDLGQVEGAAYAASPWLLDYSQNGTCISRMGNRSLEAAPHGVFPTQSEDKPQGDKWIAIACWTDNAWQQLAKQIGIDDQRYPDLHSRLEHQEEIEQAISNWTSSQNNLQLAEQLQKLGIEAVPVFSFGEQFDIDPHFKHREHFVKLDRPVTGEFFYEKNGIRYPSQQSTYQRPTPLLGEHSELVLSQFLGYSDEDINKLKQAGGIE